MLQSAVCCASEIGDTRVGKEVEAGSIGGVYYRWAIDSLKTVDHQDFSFGVWRDVGRECFGGETLASSVDGSDAETIHDTRLYGNLASIGSYALSIVPARCIGASVEDVGLRYSGRGMLVFGGAPGKAYLVVFGKVNGEGMHGKWLNSVFAPVHLVSVVEYAFVNGSRSDELEVWVVGIAHVGKVLMRQ